MPAFRAHPVSPLATLEAHNLLWYFWYLGNEAEAVPLEVSRGTWHLAVENRREAGRCFLCSRDGEVMLKVALRWPTHTQTQTVEYSEV